MANEQQRTLLVTGASGHLGRRVVELLVESRAGHIVAATRTPDKLSNLAQRGAELRRADFDDPSSLASAFAGVDRLLIISTDALGDSGRRLKQHRTAVEAAAKAGVKHAIYTSMPHAGENKIIFFAPDHKGTEDALAASPLTWTILRNYWYTDYLSMGLAPAVAGGKLFSAAGDGGAAYITREDCARAAAAALASSDTSKKIFELTGPAVVSFTELARIASEVGGRPVEYVPIDTATLKKGLMDHGVPEMFANLSVQAQLSMKQGLMGPATTAVRDLTGQSPMSVAEYFRANRGALTAGR
jgi:NAD(P)H dehydrogenase (quinone)